MFSTRFDKQDEDDQVLDELAICIILNIIRILTESETDNFDVRSPLEQQIQNQESKDSGWRFGSTKSMATYFCKTTEMNHSSYVKVPLRFSAILHDAN